MIADDDGAPGEDRDAGVKGHRFSPALREAEREILAVKTRVQGLSATGQEELDAMMATGHGKLAAARAERAAATEALECFAVSYAMARAIESPRGEIDALSAAALCYRELGRPEVAIQMWRGCIALSARHSDQQGHAHALGNAGLALRALGQIEEALVLQRLSARAALGCSDWACAVRAHVNLANLLLGEGALAGAPADRPGLAEVAAVNDADAAPEQRAPREDPELHLRAALELLDAHGDAAAAGATSMAELEMNVCMRLAALRAAAADADTSEVAQLYLRALESAVALGDAQTEASQRAHFRHVAGALEHKIRLLGFSCLDSLDVDTADLDASKA
jgi:tetratricopeptide (TPR) repeat protein